MGFFTLTRRSLIRAAITQKNICYNNIWIVIFYRLPYRVYNKMLSKSMKNCFISKHDLIIRHIFKPEMYVFQACFAFWDKAAKYSAVTDAVNGILAYLHGSCHAFYENEKSLYFFYKVLPLRLLTV